MRISFQTLKSESIDGLKMRDKQMRKKGQMEYGVINLITRSNIKELLIPLTDELFLTHVWHLVFQLRECVEVKEFVFPGMVLEMM